MTYRELLILRICCIIIFIIASIIKLIHWFAAKKESSQISNFITYYFRWYSVYALYDNDFSDLRDFMKLNNNTNKFIWMAGIVFAVSFFL